MKKSHLQWIVPLFLVGAVILFPIYKDLRKHGEYCVKITNLTNELSQHKRTDDLRSLLMQPRYQGLVLKEARANLWWVETPHEFGAKNWTLYIDLSGSAITGLRVRTEDSTDLRPEGAPEDMKF